MFENLKPLFFNSKFILHFITIAYSYQISFVFQICSARLQIITDKNENKYIFSVCLYIVWEVYLFFPNILWLVQKKKVTQYFTALCY